MLRDLLPSSVKGETVGWWKKPWSLGRVSSICFSRNHLSCISTFLHVDSLSFLSSKNRQEVREREERIGSSLALSLWGHLGLTECLDWKLQALSDGPFWVPCLFMPREEIPQLPFHKLCGSTPSLVVYLLSVHPSISNRFVTFSANCQTSVFPTETLIVTGSKSETLDHTMASLLRSCVSLGKFLNLLASWVARP